MADKEADLKIVVSTEADKKSSAKTVRELEESIYSSLKSGYIEVPAKVKTHIEGASKEFKQAQDKLLKNWEATFGKGFSASGANFESFSKDYSKFKRLAKGNYDTEQVKWITENIGKQVAAYKKAKTEFEKQIKTLDISSETNIKTKQSTSRKPRNFGTHTKEGINSNIQQENDRRYKGISSVTPKAFEDSSIDPGKTNEYEMRLSKYSSYGSNWARELSKILKEEYAKALQSLVTYIDKNYEIGTDNKLHGKKSGKSTTEAQMIADVYRQVKRELTNSVIKSESGDESITASTFTNLAAIMKVLNKTLMTELSGKSLEDSIAKTATDIANAISKPYSISEKDAMGFTDLKEGEEKGVGPGHKRTQQILSELTDAMKEWDNEIFGKIESGISRVFSSQLSNKVSQIQLSDDYKNEISKLNSSMDETLNAIKAGTKLTDTQLAYDKIENVREATADSNEKRISKENKDVNRDVARTVKSDAATGFNTDAKSDELIQLVRSILQQLQGVKPKTSPNTSTDYSIEMKKAWDTLKDSVSPAKTQTILNSTGNTSKNYNGDTGVTQETPRSNRVEKSKIYASPIRQSIWDKFETAIERITGATDKYRNIINATAEDQDLMAAERIRTYGLNNGRNPNDTGDIASIKRALELFRTNKSSIEGNPELMQKIKLTPGVEVDTTEITKKLNEQLSGKQMRNAQMGGSIPRQILGSLTGFIGMPSLEKSRAQADGLNQIMGNINRALQSVLINIQMKETELSGMEQTGQAKFTKEGYLTADSSSAAKKTLADLEEEKLVLSSILADMSAIDQIVDITGGKFSKLVKQLSFTSPVLRENNGILRNINSGLDKNGKALKFQTRTAEILNYAFQLMSRSVGQMLKNWLVQLNPITQIKRLFQDFMSYDAKWQRTMNVIKYNLRDIVRPFMEWIAQKLVDIIGFIDIISMKIQEAFGYTPISLFDQKNADKFKKTYEEISSVSAGFDELHDIGSSSSENDPENLLGEIYKPQLSQAWIDLANEIGDLFAGIITGDLGFGEAMSKILKIAWDGLKLLGGYVWDFIKNTIWPAIKDNWLEILAWILGAFVAWKGLSTLGSLLWNALFGKLTAGSIGSLFSNVFGWISKALGLSAFGAGIIEGIKTFTSGGLLATLKSIFVGHEAITAFGAWGETLGALFAQSLIAVIGVAFGGKLMYDAFEDAADNASYNIGLITSGGSKEDKKSNTGNILKGTAGGAIAGATIGSIIPVIGTGLGAAIGAISGAIATSLAPAFEQATVAAKNMNNEMQKIQYYEGSVSGAQTKVDELTEMMDILNQTLDLQKQKVIEQGTQLGISSTRMNELTTAVINGTFSTDMLNGKEVALTDSLLQLEAQQQKNEETTKKLTEAKRKLQKAEMDLAIAEDIAAGNFELAAARIEMAYASNVYTADEATKKMVQIAKEGSAEQATAILQDLSPDLQKKFQDEYSTVEDNINELTDLYYSYSKDEREYFLQNLTGEVQKEMKSRVNAIKQAVENAPWYMRLLDIGNDGKIFGMSYIDIPGYAVGTNYVPNDGLAYLHQGEAVIPKKYNQPYQPTGMSPQEQTYMQQMMNTMRSLDNTMKQGISVNGQFVQRGSDLVAVVNKTKSQTGADLLSNVSYAR